MKSILFLAIVAVALASVELATGCTRAVYLGPEGMVVDGRTMDWVEDPATNLFVFPRGMARDGAAGAASLKWTSKYGSVVCNFYDAATVDGINEKGLAANALYLTSSDYGQANGRPQISTTVWTQYALDNFATVAEAVAEMQKESFALAAPILPNGEPAVGHLALSDPSGDSAIFEYVGGKLVIHHGRQYQVMTNDPIYDKQLALTQYWQEIGGITMLPGTIRPADRFVRASFYIGAVKQSADPRTAVAATFSVLHDASVPLGLSVPNKPNVANTVWITVTDQKNRIYYFQHSLSPGLLWVDLAQLDFSEGAAVKMLPTATDHDLTGDATGKFQETKPFKFLGAE